jgi:hypothetical protein
MMPNEYADFLKRKSQLGGDHGFDPLWMPDFLFDFQKALTSWAIRKGRAAIFADCGLGKTPMFLVWAENVIRKTNGRILIVSPLAVSYQTVKEGEKFGIEVKRSIDGKPSGRITVTNYERLHLYDPSDYEGVVADESSILKNFDGSRKKIVTEFMRTKPYRLLCTATAAPNDFIELGTTSEALGEMGFMDMLLRFYKNDQNTMDTKRKWLSSGGAATKWRFKKHAEVPFWQWVSSWSRAIRRPSDIGFNDGPFTLPSLIENQIAVNTSRPMEGELFVKEAIGLYEQRQELKHTLIERCEKVADLVKNNEVAVVWCHLNTEGDLLEKLIPEAVQVSGKDSDDKKEDRLRAFSDGQIRVLITKPKIAGFGLNWQHCNHTTWFPSHSFEQYYQGIRRFWRFGQTKDVTVDIVTTAGGESVLKNLQRKAAAADQMFNELMSSMGSAQGIDNKTFFNKTPEVPSWL